MNNKIPNTPKGFKFKTIRNPKIGDYMVDYYERVYKVNKYNVKYFCEKWPVFEKIKE